MTAGRTARMCGVRQVVQPGTPELALLHALLHFNPTERPDARTALAMEYFAPLPAEEQPVLTEAPDPRTIDAAFAFEREELGANELRVLIANDLFRMQLEGAPPAGDAVDATPVV